MPGQETSKPIVALTGTRFNLQAHLNTSVVAKIHGAAQVVAVNVQKGNYYLSGHPLFDYVDKRKPNGRPIAMLQQDQGE